MKQLDGRQNNPGRPTSGNPPKEPTGNPSPRHKIGNWTKNLEVVNLDLMEESSFFKKAEVISMNI